MENSLGVWGDDMAEPYFFWKGIDSRVMGVVVTNLPPIIRPKERVLEKVATGRPGAYHFTEGEDIYDSYAKPCQCYLRPSASKDAFLAWLRGGGRVVFSNEPTKAYIARVDNQISLDKLLANYEHRSFTAPFVVEPFKYQAVADADIERTVSGQSITNPGTVASKPIIKVEGSGDITLTVGGVYIELNDISGGIIIDCTLPDCFNLDKTALINNQVTGNFSLISLPAGVSSVHWTGSVTKVTITPNWRWL